MNMKSKMGRWFVLYADSGTIFIKIVVDKLKTEL